MRMKNIILIAFLVVLAGIVSCKKDHDIPTGKVFNAESGGGDTLGGGSSTDSIIVSVSANPIDGGTVTGSGLYQQGQSCTVMATANEGYSFTNWTENDNVVSTQASYQFTVTGNRTLVANFNSNSGNHAYVDLGLPSGLLWATCNVGATIPEEFGDRYAWGEIQPKDTYSGYNYKFSDGTNYGYNAQLTKYCTKSECGYLGFVDDLTILLPEDDAATVNWGVDWRIPTNEEWLELYQNTTYIWTTQNNVDGMLFTASNGNRLFLPASPTAINRGFYWSSSLHTEYPHHAWEYRFYSNSSGCGMEKNYRYEGNPIRAVRSSMQNNTITVSANPSEGGTVTGAGTYQQGQSCTVTATANEGYSFINWTENDIQVSTDASYTFTVTGDRSLVANFTQHVPQYYIINVFANPSSGGTVNGGGTYQEGHSCTVTTTANNGYVFTSWTENGNVVSTDAIYTFTVTDHRNLVANFSFTLGEGSGTADDPYNVAAGIALQSEEPIAWVRGYIVGAVINGVSSVSSNSDVNWNEPFDSPTNVVIADDATCQEISQCIIVNLPAGKPLRTQVNLMDNSNNLGKLLSVNGKLRKYFGQAGLRDSGGTEADFVLEGGVAPPPSGTEIFTETFATGQGSFTIQDVVLPNELTYVWVHTPIYSCMKANAYYGQNYATESWLVSPSISLIGLSHATLTFEQAVNYGSPQNALAMMISTNYNGNVTTATWTELNLDQWPNGTDGNFITSTADLTQYVGQNVVIAFKYTSTTSASATWEVKNFVVKE